MNWLIQKPYWKPREGLEGVVFGGAPPLRKPVISEELLSKYRAQMPEGLRRHLEKEEENEQV